MEESSGRPGLPFMTNVACELSTSETATDQHRSYRTMDVPIPLHELAVSPRNAVHTGAIEGLERLISEISSV